jgi:hypothetical protein
MLETGESDSTTWYELLRPFIRMKALYVYGDHLEGLSGVLHEMGSDPGFLPNSTVYLCSRQSVYPFIDTRRVVGRPVQFSLLPPRPTALS